MTPGLPPAPPATSTPAVAPGAAVLVVGPARAQAQAPAALALAFFLGLGLLSGSCTWCIYDAFDHDGLDLRSAIVEPLRAALDTPPARPVALPPGGAMPPDATGAAS